MPTGIGAGMGLGEAVGRVRLDMSDLRKAPAIARAFGQQVERALDGIADGVNAVESGFKRMGGIIRDAGQRGAADLQKLSGGIRSIRGELQGLSVGAGILTGLGLRAAGNLEQAEIQMRGLTGSVEAGTAAMDRFRQISLDTGAPLLGIVEAFQILGPLVNNDVQEFERLLDLARRLAVRNPAQGVTGAATAIVEALSAAGTDFVSLRERFNIPPAALKAAVEEAGNLTDGLDLLLNSMNITTDLANEMGKSFTTSLRNAAQAALDFLGTGLRPLTDALGPLLNESREWLTTLQETDPALATFVAGLIAATAAAGPLLLILNQMIDAGVKLQQLGVLSAAGKLGILAGGAGAGAFVGLQLTRAYGQTTGDERLQNATFSDAGLAARQALFLAANTLENLNKIVQTGVIRSFETLATAGFRTAAALGGVIESLGRALPGRLGGDALTERGQAIQTRAADLEKSVNEIADGLVNGVADASRQRLLNLVPRLGLDAINDAEAAAAQERAQLEAASAKQRRDIITDWGNQIAALEKRIAEQRQNAIESYELQRSRRQEDFELQAAREREDNQRKLAQQQADFDRSIADELENSAKRQQDIREDLAKREDDFAEDYADQRVDREEKYQKRIADIEENYQKQRARAIENGQDAVLSAAARQDAFALHEARRTLQRQLEDAQENRDEQLSDAQEAYDEQAAQDREAYDKRLADAREAAEELLADARENEQERIDDLRESYARQQELDAQNRQLNLTRQQEDYDRQREQAAADHQRQLDDLAQQAANERQAINDAAVQRLADIGQYTEGWKTIQNARQQQSLDAWDDFWDVFIERFPDPADYAPRTGQFPTLADPYGNVRQYQTGGYVPTTGPAFLHAGEFVLPPDVVRSLSGMVGGGGAVAMAGGASNVTINMPIYGASDSEQTRALVENMLLNVLKRIGRAA